MKQGQDGQTGTQADLTGLPAPNLSVTVASVDGYVLTLSGEVTEKSAACQRNRGRKGVEM